MEITDANIILRDLLNDHEVLSKKAGKVLDENNPIHSFDKKLSRLCKR